MPTFNSELQRFKNNADQRGRRNHINISSVGGAAISGYLAKLLGFSSPCSIIVMLGIGFILGKLLHQTLIYNNEVNNPLDGGQAYSLTFRNFMLKRHVPSNISNDDKAILRQLGFSPNR